MQRNGCVFCIRLKEEDAIRLEACFDHCLSEADRKCFCDELNGKAVSYVETTTNGNLRGHQRSVLQSALELLSGELGKSIQNRRKQRRIKHELESVGSITIPIEAGVPLLSESFHP